MMPRVSKKLLMLVLVSLMLQGCYNKGELKRKIQSQYDHVREVSQSPGDFCFYLGSVNFPYTDDPLKATDSQWQTWNKEYLAKTLPLFTQIGFLERKAVAENPTLYRYQLTELGIKYQYYSPVTYPQGNTIHYNQFCYGKRKLLEVTDTEEHEVGGRTTSSVKQNQLLVSYTFQIEDIPAWYTNNFDKLSKVYKLDEENTKDRIYEGGITLIKGKDGALYVESLNRSIRKPTGTLED